MNHIANDQVNLGLLLLRVAVGSTMVAHGYNHFFRGGKIAGTARWFASLGMKPGILHAWLASVTELAAGSMLVLGLLTPLAAGACAGVMFVAWITNHLKNGFFIFRPGEGWEYVANLAVASLAIGALGAGEWSLDDKIDFVLHGWRGFAAAVVIGAGGAAALLVTFWRPVRPQEKQT
ncbi:MAG: putative oxidoreductase [Actinomycetota bacterium]|nr:putative oxidoreductase [Actinomycetota bacterium]